MSTRNDPNVMLVPAVEDGGPATNIATDAIRPGRSPLSRVSILVWRVIALVVFLGLWHLSSIPAGKLLLPSPVDVGPAFVDLVRSGQLLNATASSLVVFVAGYAPAIVTGQSGS